MPLFIKDTETGRMVAQVSRGYYPSTKGLRIEECLSAVMLCELGLPIPGVQAQTFTIDPLNPDGARIKLLSWVERKAQELEL